MRAAIPFAERNTHTNTHTPPTAHPNAPSFEKRQIPTQLPIQMFICASAHTHGAKSNGDRPQPCRSESTFDHTRKINIVFNFRIKLEKGKIRSIFARAHFFRSVLVVLLFFVIPRRLLLFGIQDRNVNTNAEKTEPFFT